MCYGVFWGVSVRGCMLVVYVLVVCLLGMSVRGAS